LGIPVQVELGRRGDYAVRAVLDLARHYGGGHRKAREISAEMDIPQQFLAQILGPFVRAGIVTAVAGREGGYALARPPAAVSLLDVIEMAEGPLESGECTLRGGPCDWTGPCPLHETWARARAQLANYLGKVTFAQIAAVDAAIQSGRQRASTGQPHARVSARRGVRTEAAPATRRSRRRGPAPDS
jgi:Rrf2 family protein